MDILYEMIISLPVTIDMQTAILSGYSIIFESKHNTLDNALRSFGTDNIESLFVRQPKLGR